jgi:hypothetical protein
MQGRTFFFAKHVTATRMHLVSGHQLNNFSLGQARWLIDYGATVSNLGFTGLHATQDIAFSYLMPELQAVTQSKS